MRVVNNYYIGWTHPKIAVKIKNNTKNNVNVNK